MTGMAMELYDASQEAGASDAKARGAAQAVRVPTGAFGEIRTEFQGLRTEFQALRLDIGEIRTEVRHLSQEVPALRSGLQAVMSDVAVLKWQVGSIVAVLLVLGVPALSLILRISLKLGVLSI